MRIAAVYASFDDPRVAQAIAVAVHANAERLFVLGVAGLAAARRVKEEQARLDSAFLDAAGVMLVGDRDDAIPAPARSASLDKVVVVGPAPGFPPLARQDRAVELFGHFVCVVAPTCEDEDVDGGVHLWLGGGEIGRAASKDGRAVVVVGDAAKGGGAVIIDAGAGDATATFLAADGAVVEKAVLLLAAAQKMVVQG